MKKFLAITLVLLMLLGVVACGNSDAKDTDGTPDTTDTPETAVGTNDTTENADDTTENPNEITNSDLQIDITVISGTTGMGFAQMMDANANGNARFKYNFDIVSDASLASGAIISGEADMAAVPTNLAAVLYNKTNGGIQVVAVNTLGVLYLLSSGPELASPEDLAGKTIYCCNQGANPEYISRYLLEANGFEVGKDVMLDFTYNSPDELATAIATGIVDFAILPEPKVTAVMTQNPDVKAVLSLEDVWTAVSGGTSLVQGCLVARKEFIENNKAELDAFLSDYAASIDFVNADPASASQIIAANGIIPKAPLAQKAIPNCNIAYLDGTDMQVAMDAFFQVLFAANPASVGGKLPDAGLYYIAQ